MNSKSKNKQRGLQHPVDVGGQAGKMEGYVVPLNHLHPGERGIVQSLAGGRGLLGRMAALGFTPGVRLTMIQNFGHGPIIVRVRDTRVALGRGEAGKVLVRRDVDS